MKTLPIGPFSQIRSHIAMSHVPIFKEGLVAMSNLRAKCPKDRPTIPFKKNTLDCNDLARSTNYCQLSLRQNTFMKYMNYITAQ